MNPSAITWRRTRLAYRRLVVGLLAALLAATGLAAGPAASPARAAAGDPFLALEIFGAVPMRVPAPSWGCAARNITCKRTFFDNTAFPTYLPKPSLAQFVIAGKVTDVRRRVAGGPVMRWKIGSGPAGKWVFRSSAGTRLDNAPALGTRVRALAMRVAVNGRRPLVAERITRTAATAPNGPPAVEVAYLYTGTTGEVQNDPLTGAELWTVSASATSSATFITDSAEIDAIFLPPTAGDLVTVEYVEIPAAADGNTALEIFGVATPTNRAPVANAPCADTDTACVDRYYDQTPMPGTLPVPSWAQYVVTGPIVEIETDAFGAVTRILVGSESGDHRWVFTGPETRIPDGMVVGSTIRAVVQRTARTTGVTNPDGSLQSVAEPLVAEALALRAAQTTVDVEAAYLFSGLLESKSATVWRVAGVPFAVSGAEIDPGLFVGDPVTVEFLPAGSIVAD